MTLETNKNTTHNALADTYFENSRKIATMLQAVSPYIDTDKNQHLNFIQDRKSVLEEIGVVCSKGHKSTKSNLKNIMSGILKNDEVIMDTLIHTIITIQDADIPRITA
ncbi:MAG: hypothetical protein IE916_00350 [Epsilonproteobacteria bacterium]|nr:hypothetical protein [Campylobacterota bacterium]